MIKTPQIQRKRRYKTESGYKLRGAMVWVVAGLLAGLLAAFAAYGMTIAVDHFTQAIFDSRIAGCGRFRWWIVPALILVYTALFAGFGRLLVLLRRQVRVRSEERYAEFSRDVADWFGFGALLAYVVVAAPLWLVASVNHAC